MKEEGGGGAGDGGGGQTDPPPSEETTLKKPSLIRVKDISLLGVLNWVTVDSETEKYVDIISTPRDEKWNMPGFSK